MPVVAATLAAMTTTTVRVLDPSPVVKPVDPHIAECYLTLTPNWWGCHDPQCGDSTWSHDCPTPPCWIGRAEPLRTGAPT